MDILSMALALSGGVSSWNDLPGRPFYVDGTKLESFSTTLTFDGNKAGKEIEPIYGLDTDGEAHYVKVSDGYITTADAVGRTLAMYDMAGMTGTQSANVEWPLTDSVIVPVQDGKVVSIADFVLVVYEECTLNNGSHLTPGVWFGLIEYNGTPLAYVKSISGEFTATRQVENIVKIPDKFINTEWLANSKTVFDEVLLDATAEFNNTTLPTSADMADFPYHRFTVGEETTCLVEFNGEVYTTKAMRNTDAFYMGNLGIFGNETLDTGEPFFMGHFNGPSDTDIIGLIVKEPPAAPIPVKVGFGRIEPNKLDPKYINAEWMATPAKEIMPETSIPLTEATGSNFISGTKLNISLTPGKTYAFIFDGVEYVAEDTATAEMQAQGAAGAWILIASEDDSGAADLSVLIVNENWPYSDTPGVYVSCTSKYYGEHTLIIYEDGAPKKLPAKYLPDDHINALIDAKLGVIENGTY